jgi:hypothetical protein
MDQGNNNSFSISPMSPTSNALRDATIDSNAVNEQAKAWAASRSNFGLNCDQNMDPKKMRQCVIWFDVFSDLDPLQFSLQYFLSFF